jgi:hypothetical protein
MSEALWTKFLDLQSRPITRRLRRLSVASHLFSVVVYYASAIFYLVISRHEAHGLLYDAASFLWVCMALGQAIVWTLFFRRVNATTSVEDRAQLDFGKPCSHLSTRQRFDVWVRVRREMQAGGRPPDERDFLAQREAERLAFRLLRVGLPIFVVAFWIASLLLSPGHLREELVIAAVAISGVAIPIIILPDVIGMWTQPDEVGESKLVKERLSQC